MSARDTCRRDFLRDAALAAAGALVALGAAPEAARAMLVREVTLLQADVAAGATRTYPIPAADGAAVDLEGEVILVRWEGRAYAFALACPHRGTRLEWHPAECRVFCPKHKARFRPDGAHDSGRKTRALDRYDLRREGDRVVVQLDVVYRVDENPAAWEGAVLQL